MERKENKLYDAPTVKVVEVKQEGFLCNSTNTEVQDYVWNEYYEE